MATSIPTPSIVEAAGSKPKTIKKYVERVNFVTRETSVARMFSPAGWEELGQTPALCPETVKRDT
ncbi:MAG: hypothetical protein V3T62_04350 [Alphaproteobacteria bacterium]